MIDKKIFYIVFYLVLITSIVIVIYQFKGLMDNSPHSNLCVGDSCNSNETGYSYEDNLKDPKCFYNLNFCNADYNLSDNSGRDVIGVLKQVNYQMQGDLNLYKLKIYEKDKTIFGYTIIFFLLVLLFLWLKKPMEGKNG